MPTVGLTHHLKLGDEYLMVRPNTYQKRPAPTFGARIASGDSDYNNLSIWQHWVQKCWIGGMGADEWIDDAMYDAAVGTDTTVHEEMRLSRALVPAGTGSALGSTTDVMGYKFETYENALWCLVMTGNATPSRLYYYTPGAATWTQVTLPGTTFLARSIGFMSGRMLIGGAEGGVAKLYSSISAWSGTWNLVANPAGVNGAVAAMRTYNAKLYAAYGGIIWRMKSIETPSVASSVWDGSTPFYTASATTSSNYIVAMDCRSKTCRLSFGYSPVWFPGIFSAIVL